jgi:hypothetical protein
MDQIKESDWKIYRQLHAVALERCFNQTVGEMERLVSDKRKTGRDRFWETFGYAKKRRETLAFLFDGLRRSNALLQLAGIRHHGYITDSEIARFSQETQDFIKSHLSLGVPADDDRATESSSSSHHLDGRDEFEK